MTETSTGVQYSDDGNYWWDGSAWQTVDARHPGPGTASGQTGQTEQTGQTQYSEDGKYWWDGSQWQPVEEQPGQAGQHDAIDWSKFPLLEGLTKVGGTEDWIRHIGLDPEDLNIQ